MWWTSSSGAIELQITKRQAAKGMHQGQCDADIAELRTIPAIKRQLDRLTEKEVAETLKEYGAWDASELANHNDNLDRLLWIACGDIVDGSR